MKYAQIRSLDVSNGVGIGVALFVQGCHFHCENCFNSNTWNFDGGKEWTTETEEEFILSAERPYIKRISILGGEPLCDENVSDVLKLIKKIRERLPDKAIWIYTGYYWEEIFDDKYGANSDRASAVSLCDILVDGRYVDEQRDLTLKWRGSRNQRVVDIKASLDNIKLELFCD